MSKQRKATGKRTARNQATKGKAAVTRRAAQQPAARLAKGSPRVYYVPSTHWDREWYESFQHYRFRLVDLVDQLIEIMEQNEAYRCFHFDGQAIVLEDYLEIRPERRPRLQALFDAGRMEAGPWYVMPDEFIPSGESLVRNLLLGHQVAAQFGPVSRVGFVSDIFGHNSQLPQIFRGFGLETAVVWRGTNDPGHPGVFRWQAADGSEVLAFTFYGPGYGHFQFDVRWPHRRPDRTLDVGKAVGGLQKVIEYERRRVPGSALLAFDGFDHEPPEPKIPALLEKARQEGIDIRHARLIDFFDDVRRQKLKLQVFKGELREPGFDEDAAALIPGVLSSRINLKQANARCENLLTMWVEPFAAAAGLVGHEYPAGYLRLAWRYLITNHPHDSICGCSIDQVHQDMAHRFDQCRMIAERAGQMGLRALADRTALPELAGEEDFAVTVFNPTDAGLDEVVELPLLFDRRTANRFQEWFGYEPIIGFRVYDDHGQELTAQRCSVTKLQPYKTYDRRAGYRGEKYEEVRAAVRLKLPPRGWTTLLCRPTKERTRAAGTQLVDDHTMENTFLRVAVNPNGTLDITHKASGQTYANCLTFEERADIGDGWYHGTAINDEWFTSIGSQADVAVVCDGPHMTTLRVRIVMNVPQRFDKDERVMRRVPEVAPLVITSWVTLKAGVERVEVHTEIENTIRDHRVRVLLPTGIETETYFADSPFDVAERPVALRPDAHRLKEQELETKPQYRWTAVNDGRRGLAVVSVGQPESAVRHLPARPIALTLLRGFARTVAMEREEGGQLLGRSSHDYWIVPHGGPLPVGWLAQLGAQLAGGVECIFTRRDRLPLLKEEATLPATGSWLKLGDGPLVVTACKRSEDGAAVIVRAYNPTDKAAEQRCEFAAPVVEAQLADLLEQGHTKLSKRGKAVTIPAGPREIVTVRVVLNEAR